MWRVRPFLVSNGQMDPGIFEVSKSTLPENQLALPRMHTNPKKWRVGVKEHPPNVGFSNV